MLIDLLNPVIRGWANYHQHAAATGTFDRVDHEIWRRLWRWARRRHPNKLATWVKKRYFPALDGRSWVFAADTGERTAEGKPVWKRLARTSDTKIRRHKIRRHIKIRRDANPFDPTWQPYFQERAFRKKFGISRHQAGIQPL